MIQRVKAIAVVSVLCLLVSCNGCNQNKSREKPDVSNINASVELLRFDRDLKNFDALHFTDWRNKMQERYGEFYKFYVNNFIIGPRPAGDTADIELQAIQQFLSDKYIRTIQDSIDARYTDTKDVEKDLQQMFRYFKFYLPAVEVPQVVTINSAYGAGVSPFGNNQLIVGLDMFLGEDNKDYDSIGVYAYLRHKMKREYIARYTAEAMYDGYFPAVGLNSNATLLESIIERGKKLYFISYVFPDAPDSLILGYTEPQTNWCAGSEYAIWQFFNDKDLLYKNNSMDKTRYLGEGPTTNGMPPEAPGAIGNYLGLQIVRKFMKETGGKIEMKDLIARYDSKTIMEKAKYRPSKL
jgi:hypothetical protein